MGAPAPDPLSDLSPRSRADPVVAQVSNSKEPRLETPGIAADGCEVAVDVSGSWRRRRGRRRRCKGVVDGVEALLLSLTALLRRTTWASASVSL